MLLPFYAVVISIILSYGLLPLLGWKIQMVTVGMMGSRMPIVMAVWIRERVIRMFLIHYQCHHQTQLQSVGYLQVSMLN